MLSMKCLDATDQMPSFTVLICIVSSSFPLETMECFSLFCSTTFVRLRFSGVKRGFRHHLFALHLGSHGNNGVSICFYLQLTF